MKQNESVINEGLEDRIVKQAEYVSVLRYRYEELQNSFYAAKLDFESMSVKLQTEEYHLKSLQTQLNKGKR